MTDELASTARRLTHAALLVVAVLTVLRLVLLAFDFYPLFGDEAKYWAWAKDLDFGYRTKPPMVAWLIAATTAVAGDGGFGVRFGVPLIHAATSLLLLLIGRRLFDARVGAWSAIAFCTMPAVSLSAGLVSTDPPLILFWTLALYALVRAMDDGDLRWWAGCGAAVGLGLLSKYTAVAFPISAALLAAVSAEHRRRFRPVGVLIALATAVLVFSPNLWWNSRNEWISFFHLSENADYGGSFFNPAMMAEFLASQLGVFGPIAFVALVILVVRWRRTTADPRFKLLLFFVVPLLGAITLQALLSTAYANWAAPVYASASVAVAAFLLAGHRRWLLASVVFNLVVGLSLYAYEPVRLALDLQPPKRLDPTFRVRGWPEIGAELARVRAEHPSDGVLFEYGILAAQCLYQTPLDSDEVFYWNTEPVCRNHFELTNSLQAMIGRDLLFVSRNPHHDKRWLRRFFESVEHLEPIEVRTHPDRVITLHVSLAKGFRGLPEDAFQARRSVRHAGTGIDR